jgi:hypothetical protein
MRAKMPMSQTAPGLLDPVSTSSSGPPSLLSACGCDLQVAVHAARIRRQRPAAVPRSASAGRGDGGRRARARLCIGFKLSTIDMRASSPALIPRLYSMNRHRGSIPCESKKPRMRQHRPCKGDRQLLPLSFLEDVRRVCEQDWRATTADGTAYLVKRRPRS